MTEKSLEWWIKVNAKMISKSRKKLIALFGLGILLILSGCTNTPSTSSTGAIELQWRGVFWDERVVKPLIDEYQLLNPGVTIKYANRWPGGRSETAAQSYKDDLDRILKAGNTAEIPDIFMIENTWTGSYENYATPAPSAIIDANSVKTNFYPAVSKDFLNGENVMGLPLWMDTLAIIYNKDLLAAQSLAAPPSDLTNFKNKAIQLTTRSSGVITSGGFAAGTSGNVGFAPEFLNLLFLQNGVTMVDSTGNPIFADSEDALTALQYFKSFSAANGSWDASQKFDGIAFLEGKLAMMVTTSWRLNDILSFKDAYALNLNIGVAPMPQIAGQPDINWATYWGAMVANNRPNSAAAWKFLAWLTQPEQLRKLRESEVASRRFFGILYPRTDMQSETDIRSDQYLQNFNSELPSATSWYMVNGLEVRKAFQDLIDSNGTQANISQAQTVIREIMSRQ
jgi:ABC-type glycerol-3-phosphate transport system substrate-binding protein